MSTQSLGASASDPTRALSSPPIRLQKLPRKWTLCEKAAIITAIMLACLAVALFVTGAVKHIPSATSFACGATVTGILVLGIGLMEHHYKPRKYKQIPEKV